MLPFIGLTPKYFTTLISLYGVEVLRGILVFEHSDIGRTLSRGIHDDDFCRQLFVNGPKMGFRFGDDDIKILWLVAALDEGVLIDERCFVGGELQPDATRVDDGSRAQIDFMTFPHGTGADILAFAGPQDFTVDPEGSPVPPTGASPHL